MSVLQEQVLEAVRILSENAVTNSNATLTIECEIVDVIDAGLGQYTVKYGGNQFDVYSGNNNSATYKSGDIVYVLVPEGDFTKTKMILGAVTPSASMYIDSETVNKYIPISGNLFTNINNIQLCTYHSETRNVILDTSSFNMIFNDYLNDYRNFVLTAKVKTNMPIEQQQGGNYGITLSLPFLEDAGDGTGSKKVWKTVSMDVNTMQGNPYRFNEYALQNIYMQIAEGAVYDTSRVPTMTVFVQGFAQDTSVTAADIWIKDIAFQVVEELTEEDQQGYSLTLVASDGNYFLNSKHWDSKTLTPILKLNGKDKKYDDYECYWYVEDSSIRTDSDGYHKLGGLGWKCLNKKTNVQYNEEGKMTYQYVTNIYNLIVTSSDVMGALRYKCVLTKDDVVVGGQVTLKNLNYNILVNLVSATGSSTFVKDTGYVNLIARIYYQGETDNPNSEFTFSTAWQRFDNKGNFIDDNFISQYVRINDPVSIVDMSGTARKYLETEIKFPCSLIESSNLINCTFYGTRVVNGDTVKNNLGTASLIVDVSENFAYKIMIENGDVLFKYDADGNSPLVADYDGPVSSKIKEILPLKYKMFKADGSELTEDEYRYCSVEWRVPKNSMIKLNSSVPIARQDDDYYYVTGKGQIDINYTILDTYNAKKVNNSIILVINFNGNVVTEVANIKFLKDGESGTNGSRYAGIITYQDLGYGELNTSGKPHKLHPVLVVNAWRLCNSKTGNVEAWANPTMKVKVYKDGVLITSGYSVVWSIFDSSVTNPLFNINSSSGVITAKGTTWSDATSTIVEAKITVGNAGSTHAQEVLYAYYPIEITYLSNSAYASGLIPNLDGGFDKVLYAADGTNPKYDNTNPFSYGSNLSEVDGSSYFSYSWSVSSSGNLIRPSDYTSSTCAIKPVTKFDNGKSLNYVNVSMQLTGTGKTKAQSFVTQFTNQKTSISNEISYNQGTLQHIVDFSEKFVYNNYIELLNASQKLLLNRSNLIYYIGQLLPILNNLKSYCSSKSVAAADFDYNTIYTNQTNVLIAERTKLYKLGANEVLSNLNRLSNAKISLDNPTNFRNKYGLAVFDTVNNYINSFNNILEKKYWVSYDILCAKTGSAYVLADQFTKFKQFEDNLIALCTESNLTWLQFAHYGFGPEQEFKNLKNQLTAYSKRLTNGVSYTLDSIKQDVLNNYYNSIVKYQDSYYERSYNNRIATLREELNEVNIKLADYQKIVTSQTSGYIKHSKPIVMILNRYELSNINGWDGNKLYIDANNNEYILAPQMGAGTKTNSLFTGVIMGVKQFNRTDTTHVQQIGLFGYSKGLQSFFLNSEDGSAIFGKSGAGQITIDPTSNKALLYNATYWKEYNAYGKPVNYTSSNVNMKGMLIDLTTPYIHFGDATGKIYSGSHTTLTGGDDGFYLSHDGFSIGTGFTISKTGISEIIRENSNISGWNIKEVTVKDESGNNHKEISLVSKLNNGIFMDSNQSVIVLGSDEGRIYSGSHYSLNSTAKGFYLSNKGLSISGTYTDGSNNYTSRIEISTTGNPKIFTGKHNTLDSGGDGFYLGNDGFSIGSSFKLNTGGTLQEGSKISGWSVKKVDVLNESTGATNSDICLISTENNGIFLDAPSSTIVLGNNGGRIYSGKHYNLSSTQQGFYLSNKGLSISGTYKYTEGGVEQTATSRIEINTSGDPKIYTGKHSTLGSRKDGFYLGSDGLSIGNNFIIYAGGKAEINQPESTIGQWKVVEVTEDGQLVKKLASNSNGIYLDANKSKIILGSSDGEIYSGQHVALDSVKNGFYLSGKGNNGGLSIGSKVYIDNTGTMRLGTGAVANNGKFWTIEPGNSSIGEGNETYIGYNTRGRSYVSTDTLTNVVTIDQTAPEQSVYVGTKAIRLGRKFAVDAYGNMVAMSGTFGGSINVANRFIVNPSGDISFYTEGPSTTHNYFYIEDSNGNYIHIGGTNLHVLNGGTAKEKSWMDIMDWIDWSINFKNETLESLWDAIRAVDSKADGINRNVVENYAPISWVNANFVHI